MGETNMRPPAPDPPQQPTQQQPTQQQPTQQQPAPRPTQQQPMQQQPTQQQPTPRPTPQPAPQPTQQPTQQPAPQQPTPRQSTGPVALFETGKRYQVHHSYIWLAPIAVTFAVAAAVLVSNVQDVVRGVRAIEQSTGWGLGALVGIILGVLVVVYGIIVGFHAIAYRFLSYEFGDAEFSLYAGVITKKHVHVPYARVQSVNHRASLLQRVFGVCSVAIDTAGGASNKAVRVPYVQLETAERIRAELFTRKAAAATGVPLVYMPSAGVVAPAARGSVAMTFDAASALSRPPVPPAQTTPGTGVPDGMSGFEVPGGTAAASTPGAAAAGGAPNLLDATLGDVGKWRGAFGGTTIGDEPVSYELGLNNRELILTGLSHASASTTAAVLGATMLIMTVTMALPMAEVGDSFGAWMLGGSIALIVLSIVIGWVFGVLGICISYGSFRATRRGSRIEVERGLLQREYSGIDVQRVQSVVVRQSFIRRCMGYCEISLGRIDASEGGQSNGNSAKLDRQGLVVHPFVKLDRVDEVLAGLLPEFADRPVASELTGLPSVAQRRALMRRCMWYNGALWTAIVFAVFQVVFHRLAPMTASAAAASSDFASAASTIDVLCTIVYIICVVATVFFAVGAVLWKRGSGFTFNHGYAAIRNDGLSTEFTVIPRSKIQSGYTRSNPFQRHANVTAVAAITAAGTGHTRVRLLDVRAEDGAAWLSWMLPRSSEASSANPAG